MIKRENTHTQKKIKAKIDKFCKSGLLHLKPSNTINDRFFNRKSFLFSPNFVFLFFFPTDLKAHSSQTLPGLRAR